jgi:endonuclease YncB( thermonuclease family)
MERRGILAAFFHELAVAGDYAAHDGGAGEGAVSGGRFKFNKHIAIRAFGFVAAGAALSVALVIAGALRGTPRGTAPAPQGVAAQPDGKDQNRLALKSGRRPSGQRAPDASDPGESASAPEMPLDAPLSNAPAEASTAWREDVFTAVRVLDGRTLGAGALALRIDNLDLPNPDQVCRTLDNRLEQCTARAATQLELLTRSRTVSCRYRMTTSSEGIGSCRIGSNDLAERMIRTGYVRRAEGSPAVVVAEARRD